MSTHFCKFLLFFSKFFSYFHILTIFDKFFNIFSILSSPAYTMHGNSKQNEVCYCSVPQLKLCLRGTYGYPSQAGAFSLQLRNHKDFIDGPDRILKVFIGHTDNDI